MILVPYQVPIPSNAIWENVSCDQKTQKHDRIVKNQITLNLMRSLPLFDEEKTEARQMSCSSANQ
jgi:hypothetical protein